MKLMPLTCTLRVARSRSRPRAPQSLTGAKTEAKARLAARKYVSILEKLKCPVQLKVRGAMAAPLLRRDALTAAHTNHTPYRSSKSVT